MARKRLRDAKITGMFSTTIAPKPPFYLFVPSIHEIPKNVLAQMKGSAFALGDFYKTDSEAVQAIKKAGYDKSNQVILEQQGYLVTKKKLKELV